MTNRPLSGRMQRPCTLSDDDCHHTNLKKGNFFADDTTVQHLFQVKHVIIILEEKMKKTKQNKQTNETEIMAAKQKIISPGAGKRGQCVVLPHAARDTKRIVTDKSSSDALHKMGTS